ncbi:MAG: hypothetical protein ACUVR2_02700 [Anaerolineae bacterium]
MATEPGPKPLMVIRFGERIERISALRKMTAGLIIIGPSLLAFSAGHDRRRAGQSLLLMLPCPKIGLATPTCMKANSVLRS